MDHNIVMSLNKWNSVIAVSCLLPFNLLFQRSMLVCREIPKIHLPNNNAPISIQKLGNPELKLGNVNYVLHTCVSVLHR